MVGSPFNLPCHCVRVSFLSVLSRRDSASQEPDIHVGTPRRGNTQRIKTMYAAKSATNQSQSGIRLISSCSLIGIPDIGHVIDAIEALDHSLVMGDHDDGRLLRASQMPDCRPRRLVIGAKGRHSVEYAPCFLGRRRHRVAARATCEPYGTRSRRSSPSM